MVLSMQGQKANCEYQCEDNRHRQYGALFYLVLFVFAPSPAQSGAYQCKDKRLTLSISVRTRGTWCPSLQYEKAHCNYQGKNKRYMVSIKARTKGTLYLSR